MFLSVALVSLMGISPVLPEKAMNSEITKEVVSEIVLENKKEFRQELIKELREKNLIMLDQSIAGLKGGDAGNAERVVSQK